MKVNEQFWNASVDELKQGYMEENDYFTCLLCETKFEKGLIYPDEGKFYETERYMRVHIENMHQSVFDFLLDLDKKITGITEHQKNILSLFYQGKSDKEVQNELSIGSPSTVRHHRFTFKEKERQAKTFLTLMELLKDKDEKTPAFVPVHKHATMVDDRYNITQEEQAKVVQKYFSDGLLTKFPSKEKQRLIVLREIFQQLKVDHVYDEKELNHELKGYFEDYVLIRRYLIEYGFLDRKADGSQYWVKK